MSIERYFALVEIGPNRLANTNRLTRSRARYGELEVLIAAPKGGYLVGLIDGHNLAARRVRTLASLLAGDYLSGGYSNTRKHE